MPCNSPTILIAILLHAVLSKPTGISGTALQVLFSLVTAHVVPLATKLHTCVLTPGYAASLTR